MSFIVLFICCIRIAASITTVDAAETRCIERERRALLQLKNGLLDDYGIFSSWSSHKSSKDCCLWRGVFCSNRTYHVVSLDLHGYWSDELGVKVGLRGEINSSLLELNHLNHLDLSFNSFTRIPEFIGSLTNLRYLNLSNNDLKIPKVPSQLGNLSQLQTLDLLGSSIILKNTEWLSKLSSLKYLSISYVDLSESNNLLENVIMRLPSLFELHLVSCSLPNIHPNTLLSITNISKTLSILDMSINYLSSYSVYPWLFNLSGSLTSIDFSYNELLDTIPEAFGTFSSLQNLRLTENGFKGGIPTAFGNLSNLESLYLDGNNLKEDLPNFFRKLSGSAQKSIQVLELSDNNLTGSLPDFSTFTALRELHLKNNELKGSFPEKFERISNLFILDLADNKIKGFLPDLSALSSLRVLYFEGNRLEGILGERIMTLSELQVLGVSSNLLHGTISETHLANLSSLVYLDLSYNSLVLELGSPTFSLDVISLSSCKLGPSFPTWLQTQNNFSIIDISDAQINDSVPDWFWKQLTPNLRFLNFSSNHLHGTVPDFKYGNQAIFDLSSNNLSGPVPLFPSDTVIIRLHNNMFSESIMFLWNLTSIAQLDLSNNQLSGEIPDFWMNLTRIITLNLENNKFIGKIPTSMGSLSYILMLSMRNNRLTGDLPSSLQNCTFLKLLDVGENNLSGRIPSWIGKSLSELRILSLPSNGFHGSMPTSLCRLSNMQILDISVNKIFGTIPRCISYLKGMAPEKDKVASLDFSLTGLARSRLATSHFSIMFQALLLWKGRESKYSRTLGLVISLDLSSNKFNGAIPHEITNLSGLVALNLSRNNFTMQIPQDIGKLRSLDFLDLSVNHLIGSIPTSLSQLTNLGVLDLSNNSLSGRIPTGTQLQTFGASSYTGNPGLCGFPLSNACPGDLGPQNLPTTVQTGDQDKLITRGFFISLLIGVAFGFWVGCGTLLVRNSWRYAYFEFLNHVKDWIYVMVVVNYARLKRCSSA